MTERPGHLGHPARRIEADDRERRRGRPAAVTDATGVTTAYFYDDHGLLREVDDPRSGKTTSTTRTAIRRSSAF
jgi:YD repeat-containing protein